MSERLVTEKSKTQRQLEAVLQIIVPAAVGGALWRWAGPGFANCLAVVTSFFLVGPVGQLLANLVGGKWITREERLKRALARAAATRFPILVGMTWLTFSALFLSGLCSALSAEQWSAALRPNVVTILAMTLALSLIYAFQLRRMHRKFDPAREPVRPFASPKEWMLRGAPIQILFQGLGLAGGFVAAHYVPAPYPFACLALGWLLGLGLETLAAELLVNRKPLMWHQMGFWSALIVSMLRIGLPMGALISLNAVLTQPALTGQHGETLILALVIGTMGLIGFVFGTILMLMVWAFARLGDLRARRKES